MFKKYLIMGFIIFASVIGLGTLSYAESSADKPFEFALIGDWPYSAEQAAKFPSLIADINRNAQFLRAGCIRPRRYSLFPHR